MVKTNLPKRYKFAPELLREIEDHCYTTLDFEVGGMLFGKITASSTQINGFVPALRASKQVVTLTFTHEVWESILKEGEERFPGQQIVGWYHTHPGFGVFLSDYDKFIQTEFFKQKGQVALVVDPVAGKLGWFEAAGEDVKQIAADVTSKGPRQKKENGPAVARKRPSFLALGIAAAASFVAGLAGGSAITLLQTPPDLRETLQQALVQIDFERSEKFLLQEQLGFLDGALVLVYFAQSGDTAESISSAFYGSPEYVQILVDANPEIDFSALSEGQEIKLVAPNNLRLSLPEPKPLEESEPEQGSNNETDSSTTVEEEN